MTTEQLRVLLKIIAAWIKENNLGYSVSSQDILDALEAIKEAGLETAVKDISNTKD